MTRDQVGGDVGAVELAQMTLDVASAHASRIKREDLVVEAVEPALMLAHHFGVERGVAVSRDVELDRSILGLDGLRRVPVAAIARASPFSVVRLVAQMVGHLGFEHALYECALELLQQPLRAKQIFRFASSLEQLFEQLVLDVGRQRIHRCAFR